MKFLRTIEEQDKIKSERMYLGINQRYNEYGQESITDNL